MLTWYHYRALSLPRGLQNINNKSIRREAVAGWLTSGILLYVRRIPYLGISGSFSASRHQLSPGGTGLTEVFPYHRVGGRIRLDMDTLDSFLYQRWGKLSLVNKTSLLLRPTLYALGKAGISIREAEREPDPPLVITHR